MKKETLFMKNLNKIFGFQPTGTKVQTGKLLVAEPFMPDYYFKRAVLLLADYDNNEGSFGLIINKKTEYNISEITSDFNNFDAEVYLGGPVQTDNLFYLHRRGDIIKDSLEILPGVFWGGDFEQLVFLINEGIIHREDIRFYLGYAGWSPKQLDKELKEISWLVTNVSSKEIFNAEPESLWQNSIKKLGHDFTHWLNFPVNPQLN